MGFFLYLCAQIYCAHIYACEKKIDMRIKSLTLSNYRNYKDAEIKFGERTTVIIGKNGMGKTNLVAALKQALSFIFAKKKYNPYFDLIASSDQRVKSITTLDARYGRNDFGYDYNFPVSVKGEMLLPNGKDLQWEFHKETASSGMDDYLYGESNLRFWEFYTSNRTLPVIAYFSDSYPHVKTNIGKNVQGMLDSGFELPKNIAYYKWDEEKNCTGIWMQYYLMQYKNNKFSEDKAIKSDTKKYIKYINETLIRFSTSLPNSYAANDIELKSVEVEARGKEEVMMFQFANGMRIPFDQLPQGYKRIFSIVFDIASRAYFLNGSYGPEGIVLIDEIELHLHPSLAQEILQRLEATFPGVQFVVTTHSPLVLSSYQQGPFDLLYKLVKNEEGNTFIELDSQYGVDYNTLVHSTMDTPERNEYIQKLLRAYQYWFDMDNREKCAAVAAEIREKAGEESRVYQELKRK